MFKLKKVRISPWLPKVILLILALFPVLYLNEFYIHFRAYLTGTVITGIIKNEWHLVIFFIILFMLFVVPLSYRKRTKWVDYSLVGAFFISLFIEMYGLPLTLLFASKYLFMPGVSLPANVIELDFLGVGLGMDHAMVYGSVLMLLGIGLIVFGWYSLYGQVKSFGFASTGLYNYSRHPQYLGFIFLVTGWFFGWPTILTLIFSPILIYKYLRSAQAEEKEMLARYGKDYYSYIETTPFLI